MFFVPLSLIICAIIVSDAVASIVCNGLVFDGVYYEKELLFEGLGKPYSLVMHSSSGLLFFSHTIWNGTRIDFGILACHIERKTCRHIEGIAGGYAIAYDRRHDGIYFGGHNGLYKYNFETQRADYFSERHKSIWGIFIGKNFYYIEYPSQKLHMYKYGKFELVPKAADIEIDHFYISRHRTIYFSNETGLYKVDDVFRKPVVLNKKILVRQITEDIYGDIYFCAHDGIYAEHKPYHRINKVADIEHVYSITFVRVYVPKQETDQLIYSDADAIYRLVESRYSTFCSRIIDEKGKERKKTMVRTHNRKHSNIVNAH